MKIFVLTLLTATILAITLTACKSPLEEPLVETYKFRRNAVYNQTDNLIGDIGETYTDKKAVMGDLETFIIKNPRVAKVTLASVPMAKYPFSISLTQVQRAAPQPIGKYISKKRFNRSDDMVWYRKLLLKKVAFWYQPASTANNDKIISYVYPVLKELNPAVILYVLKLDFYQQENPVLFWNVPKKFYAQELLKREEEYVKSYLRLKKEAEQRELKAESAKQFREAKVYYYLKLKEVKKTGRKRAKELQKSKKEQTKSIFQ